jgi:Kyakuja-Dileera-Zisupton transposase
VKYPLACVQKLATCLGESFMMGYDIACTHSITAWNALGPLIKDQNIEYIISLFHGYAHHHLCQLRWLPLYHTGSGLEDFEGLECCFSTSNALAHVMRYASPWACHMWIEIHFARWNEEKHVNLGEISILTPMLHTLSQLTLGTFLLSNYVVALEIINTTLPFVEQFCKPPYNLTPTSDFPWLLNDKYNCLKSLETESLETEPLEYVWRMTYVDAINNFKVIKYVNWPLFIYGVDLKL